MSEDLPRHIGRYEIITLLGEGGMARAYLAVSHGPGGFNKLAVIKQILPKLARDAEFVAMFLDEARLAARLHHPNIVQTFDVVEHRGTYSLAMEYLEGLSLSAIYKRIHPRLLPVETHLWVLTQVLTGLHYAHTLCDYDGTPLGVVHRDVNPANVLVTYGGDVKLLDFGVAKARGAMASSTERSIRGKPAYCAPEQLRGLEPDARADVFAVGVMMWEVLAGRRLNKGKSLVEAARIRLSGSEPPIRAVCPEVDPTLAEICDRALAMDPEQRFASAAEFRMEVQAQLEKRNGQDRRIMVERLEEVFAADRNELRKLIENALADTGLHEMPGSIPEQEGSGVQPRPMGSVAKPVSVSVGAGTDARSLSALRLRILLGAAVVGLAVLTGVLMRSVPAPPPQTSRDYTAQGVNVDKSPSESPTASAILPPPSTVPVFAPTVITPEPKAEPTANTALPAEPAALTPEAEARAPVTRLRPVRPHKRTLAHSSLGRHSMPRTADLPASLQKPDKAPAAPKEDLPPSPSPAARRSPPSEQPASAVQPGAHLFRRTTPARNTVDEKDPYTP
jgi:eukaryotic-like serine/threonine-protein kinase